MSSTDAVSSWIINSYSNSSESGSALSEDTIRKLEKYGIDISSVSSETEARKLIAEAEKEEEEKLQSSENARQESLFERVKSLAGKVGVSVGEDDNLESILSEISSKLDDIKGDGYGSNYNVLKSEYETLKLQYDNELSGGSSMLSALDILGQSNRMGMGL